MVTKMNRPGMSTEMVAITLVDSPLGWVPVLGIIMVDDGSSTAAVDGDCSAELLVAATVREIAWSAKDKVSLVGDGESSAVLLLLVVTAEAV